MTALDQAFIKAYQQDGVAPSSAILDSAQPVSLTEALTESPKEQDEEAGQGREEASAEDAAEGLADAVLSVLEVGSAAVEVGTTEVGAIEIGPVEIGNARIAPETPPRVESLGIVEIAPRADHGEPAAVAGDSPFRPLLQVDSFAWPTVCTDLHAAAGVELDQLAAGVMTEGGRRRKVVAMGSVAPGEGCTTMLLCAARRLARRGLNVVIVDADLADPQLAGRLGLAPESGWEEVAAGRASPADVLIESIEDRITLLPLQSQPGPAGRTILDDPSLLGGLALELLRQHYDLVLIDVGALGSIADNVTGNPPQSRAAGNWIDATVIVQDIRSTAHDGVARDGVARVRNYLDAVGIPLAGVAENFVHA